MEDKSYIKHQYFYENIRRGNSLLKIDEEFYFCRRGLKKFYDLEKEFLSDHGNTESGYKKKVKEGIFTPILKSLEEGKRIILHRLFKENGEHC